MTEDLEKPIRFVTAGDILKQGAMLLAAYMPLVLLLKNHPLVYGVAALIGVTMYFADRSATADGMIKTRADSRQASEEIQEIAESLSKKARLKKSIKAYLYRGAAHDTCYAFVISGDKEALYFNERIYPLDKNDLRPTMAHEISHIKARDTVVLALAAPAPILSLGLLMPFNGASKLGTGPLAYILYAAIIIAQYALYKMHQRFTEERADRNQTKLTGQFIQSVMSHVRMRTSEKTEFKLEKPSLVQRLTASHPWTMDRMRNFERVYRNSKDTPTVDRLERRMRRRISGPAPTC